MLDGYDEKEDDNQSDTSRTTVGNSNLAMQDMFGNNEVETYNPNPVKGRRYLCFTIFMVIILSFMVVENRTVLPVVIKTETNTPDVIDNTPKTPTKPDDTNKPDDSDKSKKPDAPEDNKPSKPSEPVKENKPEDNKDKTITDNSSKVDKVEDKSKGGDKTTEEVKKGM